MTKTPLAVGAAILSIAMPGWADQVIMDDLIVENNACFGSTCADGEAFDFQDGTVRIKSANPVLDLVDIDTAPQVAGTSWRILAGDGAEDALIFRDQSLGTDIFKIQAGGTQGSMIIDNEGNVGIGTQFPFADLEIRRQFFPTLRLSSLGGGGLSGWNWELTGDGNQFSIIDSTTDKLPFGIAAAAPTNALFVAENGNVGIGTGEPTAQFEMVSENAFNFFRISATGAAVNESVDITFTGGPLGTGQLRYNIVDGDNQEMSLDADGNMVLDGTLTTGGPTCAGGCDRVFDEEYALASVKQHASAMYSLGHLPAVGPTEPHAPVNITEKLASVINELEHAHIYIAQQDAMLDRLQRHIAEQDARLDALENR